MRTIDKSTLQFLSGLKKNNNKQWFASNKELYHQSQNNILEFTNALIQEISKFDATIKKTRPEQCLFRIYKDVRFSKDKTPYKTNFGAFICPGGRKTGNAGYYLHIQPDASMLAGGMYHPEPARLEKIRKKIDSNAAPFKRILNHKDFKKYFKELKGDQLKTVPRGYAKDHPEKELLRYKDYLVVYDLKNNQLTKKDFFDQTIDVFKKIKPLSTYLNKITQ